MYNITSCKTITNFSYKVQFFDCCRNIYIFLKRKSLSHVIWSQYFLFNLFCCCNILIFFYRFPKFWRNMKNVWWCQSLPLCWLPSIQIMKIGMSICRWESMEIVAGNCDIGVIFAFVFGLHKFDETCHNKVLSKHLPFLTLINNNNEWLDLFDLIFIQFSYKLPSSSNLSRLWFINCTLMHSVSITFSVPKSVQRYQDLFIFIQTNFNRLLLQTNDYIFSNKTKLFYFWRLMTGRGFCGSRS